MPAHGETMGEATVLTISSGVGLVVISLLICLWFADKRTPWHCIMTIWLSFFTAFSVVLLVPFDIANARDTVPGAGNVDVVNIEMLTFCWTAVYWTAFLLTWVVLGLQQRAISCGGFTLKRTLDLALRGEAKYYAVALVLFVVFVFGNMVSKGPIDGLAYLRHDFPGLCTGLSHTTALIILVFLLGFGLVELPRSLWRRGDLTLRLEHLYLSAPAASKAVRDATAALRPLAEAALSIISDVDKERERQAVRSAAATLRSLEVQVAAAVTLEETARIAERVVQNLRTHSPADVVKTAGASVAAAEADATKPSLLQRWTSGHSSDRHGAVRLPSIPELEKLNAQCSTSLAAAQRSEQRWQGLCDEAWAIEEILLAKQQGSGPLVWFQTRLARKQATRPDRSSGDPCGCCAPPVRAFIFWHWVSWLRGVLCRAAAVTCAGISAMELLAFSSAAVDPSGKVSLLALLLDKHSKDQFMIIVLTFVPVVYLATVVYFSLFNVRVFKKAFEMRGGRATDAVSLLFVSRSMSWMTAPLCYSFLLQSGEQTLQRTAFSTLYSVAPLPGFESLSRWLPVLIVLVAGLEASSSYSRLVKHFGMDALLFDEGETGAGFAGKQEVLSARTGDGCTHADVALARAASAAVRGGASGVSERTPLLVDSSRELA